jgi:flagellar hook-associated protein 3 FlgL
MRISTNQFYQTGLNSILDQQNQLSITQGKISTGLKVTKPSDDPIATISIINLEQEIAITERYNKNADLAASNLNIEEASLQKVIDVLQRVRELTLSAGNATYGDVERNSLAVEMEGILEQVVGLANFKDSSGVYLFGGNSIDVRPFTQNAAGDYVYNGDEGVRNIQISTSTQIASNDSGFKVFQNILNGNGDFQTTANVANTGTGVISVGSVVDRFSYVRDSYTIDIVDLGGGVLGYDVTDSGGAAVATGVPLPPDGDIAFNGLEVEISGTPAIGDSFSITPSSRQNVFKTIQDTITALKTPVSSDADAAQLNNNLQNSLLNIDAAMQNIGSIQAEVGTRLNVIENQQLINTDFILTSKVTLSKARDLDIAEAVTDLNIRKIALEAAQASFVRVQNLSLFNFIR